MRGRKSSPDPEITTDEEQHAVIRRILASSLFEKSSRLSDFLKYISDRSLSGHPEEVREQFIGHHVFERPVDYNPADDNIVRVTARQLRAKLREYFQTEGRNERWLVEMPKGGYLLVFRERKRQAPNNSQSSDGSTNATPLLRKRAAILIIIAALVLLLFGAWGWQHARLGTQRAKPAPTSSPVLDVFAHSPGPVEIILSDSALLLMQYFIGHPFSLAQYEDRSYLDYPHVMAKSGLRRFWGLLRSRQISNIGDQEASSRFLASLLPYKPNVTIRNACNMTVRDFMNGNFILLGSAYSNPWAQLFTKGLNFQFAGFGIRNLKPSKGEKTEYLHEPKGNGNWLSYARIALVPNLTNTGRVLLVAGIGMASTEAASDFLLEPSSTQKLRKILGSGNHGRLPNFELVLQTSSIAGAPETGRIVAFRIYRNNPNQ